MWNLFYRYPRLLFLTLCLILVSGLSALKVLPRSEDPRLEGRWSWVMTRFPFSLVYFESESAVEVLALAHQKRKPGYWRERR